MKKDTIYKIVLTVLLIGSIFSIMKSCGTYQDITGTVIAKSGDIATKYKSREIFTEYVLVVHPDDSRLEDFDMVVPLHTYIKFEVGDKIVSHDTNINQHLKNPKWYEKERSWATIFLVFSFLFVIIFVCLLCEKNVFDDL